MTDLGTHIEYDGRPAVRFERTFATPSNGSGARSPTRRSCRRGSRRRWSTSRRSARR